MLIEAQTEEWIELMVAEIAALVAVVVATDEEWKMIAELVVANSAEVAQVV